MNGDGIGRKSGFTMIELLVVIAVIGVLAVAVLSSINPIEQINKGRDTRTRSDVAQLINASDRYFAIHEEYPWDTDNNTTPADPYNHNNGNGEWDWLDLLVDTAEVKQGFVNRVEQDDAIRLFKEGDENGTVYGCFLPRSQAFKLEAMNNCADDTTPDNGDPEVPGGAIDPCEDDTDQDADNYACLP